MQEDENIVFEDVTHSMDFEKLKLQKTMEEEKEYNSLYEELLDKCNPKNFFSKDYINKMHFDISNEIYAELCNTQNISESELVKLRNRAIEELGVYISTKKLFEELTQYLNPEIYISIKPYNAEKVKKAGDYYNKVLNAKLDILELEKIKIEASEFIEERKKIKEELDRQWQKEKRKYIDEERKKIREELDNKENKKFERFLAILILVAFVLFVIFIVELVL